MTTNSRNIGRIWFLFDLIMLCAIAAQASTLPPDPNNAALLYYQAFLLRPEPNKVETELVYNRIQEISRVLQGGELEADANIDERIRELEEALKNHHVEPNEPNLYAEYDIGFEPYPGEKVHLRQLRQRREMMRGVDPNKSLRTYLFKCRDAIKMAEMASEIAECDWGIMYSRGHGRRAPQSMEIRHLTFVLRAEALLHAADGDHRAAFDRCLMMRRFAGHVGEDNQNLYLMSIAVDSVALGCIQFLLTSSESSQETLTWLKRRLAVQKDLSQSFAKVLNRDFELTLQTLHTNRKVLKYVGDEFAEKAANDAARQRIQDMTDDELIALAKAPYADYLDSVVEVINSRIPYEQKCARMKTLAGNLESEHGDIGVTRMMLMSGSEMPLRSYEIHVRHTAHLNAIMTGVEILLIHAQTGQLPEELPDDLPKDPFTGKLFGYKQTEDGFALICPDEVFQTPGRLSLEFKVKK